MTHAASPRSCHFIVLSEDGHEVAGANTLAGWLLPFRGETRGAATERTAWYADAASEFAAGMNAHVIHCARFRAAPNTDAIEVYALVEKEDRQLPPGMTWLEADRLAHATPAIPPQRRALQLALSRTKHPEGLFDAVPAARTLRQWLAARIRDEAQRGLSPGTIRWRRQSRGDAVGAYLTTAGYVFVKAGQHRVDDEAMIAHHIDALIPGCTPDTLALDRDRYVWVTAEVRGEALHRPTATPETLRTVTGGIAALQQAASGHRALMDHLAARPLTGETLRSLVPFIDKIASREAIDLDDVPPYRPDLVADYIAEWSDRLGELALPVTWLHSDLAFSNVLMNRDRWHLVDLEYGYAGPGVLALWPLLRDAWALGPVAGRAIEDAYVESSGLGAHREQMLRRVFHQLPALGRLVRLHMLRQRLADHDAEDPACVDELYPRPFQSTVQALLRIISRAD
jgi:hypothetical protein